MLSVIVFLIILLMISLIYLFFAPFYIEINSINNLYRIRLHRMASISFKIENEEAFLEINILSLKRKKSLLNAPETPRKINSNKNKKNEVTKIPYKKIVNVIKSFRINKCTIDLDFGDMQVNGIFYPVFVWLSLYFHKHIALNFVGKNEIIFETQNSIARMSWAYISSKI